jgi:hypothetical protein
MMETIMSILLGLGLSAACGFRVFVPLLMLSAAVHTGHLSLASGFDWIGSTPALVAFATATVLEIAGYYLPWVDNFLDAVTSPASVIAGTLVTASVVTDLDPLWRWSLALIAGGGLAGLVQGTTVAARGTSTATTLGLTNPVLATAELGGSVVTSVVSLWMPVLVIVLLVLFFACGGTVYARLRRRHRNHFKKTALYTPPSC